jgi:LacI family transcriptional regulator
LSKPTIKDVAEHARVSIGTVSRVLNRSGYFDEETGKRVREAVQSLGYRRNVHWKRLSSNSSRTLSFLLGNRTSLNSMQMKMLVACERVCNERGYDLVFSRFEYSAETKSRHLELPRILADDGVVDGVILIGRHSHNLIETFDRSRFPWVLLGNNFDGDLKQLKCNTVSYDDEIGTYEATSYLVRLGHRRIAFIGNARLPWFERRRAGYQRAMDEHGLGTRAVTSSWEASTVEQGRLSATELMRDETPPTAILASNDELAAGVWKELTHRGVRIPAEISLCGFGDREEFQILEPSLTTMAVFPERLGADLAQMLLERIEDPKKRVISRTFPCRLVERQSCAPPTLRPRVLRA